MLFCLRLCVSILINFRVILLLTSHFSPSGIVTLTSAVSLWQFLHAWPIPEKALSGWSNLLSFALRKNVVKGSYRHKNRQNDFKRSLLCEVWHAFKRLLKVSVSVWSRYLLFWASTSVLNEQWSKGLCSGQEACCRRPMSRSALRKTPPAWDSAHRLARRSHRENIVNDYKKKHTCSFHFFLREHKTLCFQKVKVWTINLRSSCSLWSCDGNATRRATLVFERNSMTCIFLKSMHEINWKKYIMCLCVWVFSPWRGLWSFQVEWDRAPLNRSWSRPRGRWGTGSNHYRSSLQGAENDKMHARTL